LFSLSFKHFCLFRICNQRLVFITVIIFSSTAINIRWLSKTCDVAIYDTHHA
jgi:hypothetical protein